MSKIIPILLLTVSTGAVAQECLLTEKVVSRDISLVQDIRNVHTNLSKWKDGRQTCTATLEGSINGKWGSGTGTFTWDGQSSPEKACLAAVDLAKKNLLESQKDSTINSVSVVTCKEVPAKDRVPLNTKVGQIIDNVSVLRKHPRYPNTFVHNGQNCRWYIEAGWDGKDIDQMNGIVCKYNASKWIVVDKF